jgi:putative transposase
MMLVRGVFVTDEAIRQWCQKFGQTFANDLRRRRPRPGDKWHLDEVLVKINGQRHHLWRAVDQAGVVLDILVQPHREQAAAKRFFRQLLKGHCQLISLSVTDTQHIASWNSVDHYIGALYHSISHFRCLS